MNSSFLILHIGMATGAFILAMLIIKIGTTIKGLIRTQDSANHYTQGTPAIDKKLERHSA